MMTESSTKRRSKSMRHTAWDYAGYGCYFVTICTKDSRRFFGEIEKNGDVSLNEIGLVAKRTWMNIPSIKSNVELDEFVVMPNHIHGVLTFYNDSQDNQAKGWQKGSLGSIINQYKGLCTKLIRESGCSDFAWQRNFYDHVIRNEKDLQRIRKYIRSNPEAEIFGREV